MGVRGVKKQYSAPLVVQFPVSFTCSKPFHGLVPLGLMRGELRTPKAACGGERPVNPISFNIVPLFSSILPLGIEVRPQSNNMRKIDMPTAVLWFP